MFNNTQTGIILQLSNLKLSPAAVRAKPTNEGRRILFLPEHCKQQSPITGLAQERGGQVLGLHVTFSPSHLHFLQPTSILQQKIESLPLFCKILCIRW